MGVVRQVASVHGRTCLGAKMLANSLGAGTLGPVPEDTVCNSPISAGMDEYISAVGLVEGKVPSMKQAARFNLAVYTKVTTFTGGVDRSARKGSFPPAVTGKDSDESDSSEVVHKSHKKGPETLIQQKELVGEIVDQRSRAPYSGLTLGAGSMTSEFQIPRYNQGTAKRLLRR